MANSKKVTGTKKAAVNKRAAPSVANPKNVTSAAEWKARQGAPLDLPSGNTCLVRPVGMEAFFASGMIPNSLRQTVMQSLKEGNKAPDLKMSDMDEQQITDMFALYNTVTCFCVVEPHVTPVPVYVPADQEAGLCGEDDLGNKVPPEVRESPDYTAVHGIEDVLLYADDVDWDDKLFIFQFAMGGTRDLERFREQQARNLAIVLGSEDVGGAAESTA